MKHLFLLIWLVLSATATSAASPNVVYTRRDSIRVTALLRQAAKMGGKTNFMIYFARQLKDIPYVAKTLERNAEEALTVNLYELDCTTYVETVAALTLCRTSGQLSFGAYCNYLRQIRYADGIVSYPTRLHYFSSWIESNTAKGYVREINKPNPPFSARQTLNINFMSAHTSYYPMLVQHPAWVRQIAQTERLLTGRTYPFIPKQKIANTALYRKTIKDGDIIAINTSKRGLDTSHIGIAVWHKDGLHLLNASQIHGKVVEESMTLRTYMSKHPAQTGIRVIRLLSAQTARP